MNIELDSILRHMERTRGINRDVMLQTITNALQTAAKKSILTSGDVRVEINPQTLAITAVQRRTVSNSAKGSGYISLAEASKINPGAQVGDTVETPVDPRVFGRIAAQTAKQAILQGVHDAERDIMRAKYADQVGRIVTAHVRQISHKDTICDIGDGGEAILKGRDRMKTDRFSTGDEFRAVIRFVGTEQDPRRMSEDEAPVMTAAGNRGARNVKLMDEPVNTPCVKLSRTDPMFVYALFAEQSTELKDRTVEIVNIARKATIRCKVAVRSLDPKVDAVGACVGVKGSRIRNVINELRGEKIDIVEYSDNIEQYARQALSPAVVERIEVNHAAHQITAYIDRDRVTPAIGRGGINTKLASDLIGWNISVREISAEGGAEEAARVAQQERFQRGLAEKVQTLASILSIDQLSADTLTRHGYLSPEGIIEATLSDFVAEMTSDHRDDAEEMLPVLTAEMAQQTWRAAEAYILAGSPDPVSTTTLD